MKNKIVYKILMIMTITITVCSIGIISYANNPFLDETTETEVTATVQSKYYTPSQNIVTPFIIGDTISNIVSIKESEYNVAIEYEDISVTYNDKALYESINEVIL